MGLRITTWNVNGIRNPFGYQPWRDNRSFEAMFNILEADIVVMQELKIQRKDLKDDMVLVPGWDCYFSLPKHKKGYSGVGIYTRQSVCAPIRAEEGILGVLCPPDSSTAYRDLPATSSIGGYPTYSQIAELGVDPAALDAEGRCVVLEFPAFVLFGVYSPANSNGLRDDFRFAFWNALDARIRNLDKMGKRVILTGDLNVSCNELDSAGAEEDRKKAGMSHEEYISTPNRRIFNQLVEGGEVVGARDEERQQPVLSDLCRSFHAGRKGMYTHWEQKINARPGNYGSRIDYVLCSITMKEWFYESNIQEGLMGSDHCPVYALLKEVVNLDSKVVSIRDILNPLGSFHDGHRLIEQDARASPSLSARLLPEFDRRRSIRDMFTRQNSSSICASSQQQSSSESQSVDGPKHAPGLTTQSADIKSPQPTRTNLALNSYSDTKRKPPSQSMPSPNKRLKPTSESRIRAQGAKNQQTLKSFFQPKPTQVATPKHDTSTVPLANTETPGSNISPSRSVDPSPIDGSPAGSLSSQVASPKDDEARDPSPPVFDPIISKEGWTKLFTKPRAPICEGHSEPCITLETKKKGFNCGRSFWICARPVGPTGTKEKNTQWRCGTFIWASDWTGA